MNRSGIDFNELMAENFDMTGQYRMVNRPNEPIDKQPIKSHPCCRCGSTSSVIYSRVVDGKEEYICSKCIP